MKNRLLSNILFLEKNAKGDGTSGVHFEKTVVLINNTFQFQPYLMVFMVLKNNTFQFQPPCLLLNLTI